MQLYASKFGKLSSGHRTGRGQFSFQSQRKAMPKNAQTSTCYLVANSICSWKDCIPQLLGDCCSVAQSWLFVTQWIAACHAFLSFTISQSLLKFMSTESLMLSNHLILCHSFLLLPSIFPSIRVFFSESALASAGQSIGASTSASVLTINIQGLFPLGLTAVFLPGESQGWGSLVDCHLWGHTESDTTEAT